MEKTFELAFFPATSVGHLAPMVELAKLITSHDRRISITLFVMSRPFHPKVNAYTESLLANDPPPRVRFVLLPLDEATLAQLLSMPDFHMVPELVNIHKLTVRELLVSDYYSAKERQLAGFVVDFFCIPFTEVADEFCVPTYMFLTCAAGILSFLFHLQSLHDENKCDIVALKDSDTKMRVPGFVNLVPANVLPSFLFEKDRNNVLPFLKMPWILRKIKGILVNSFLEFEPHAVGCLLSDVGLPPTYAVGPVLNLYPESHDDVDKYKDIITWLDIQPVESVVFLCFGSMGMLEAEQVVEIARALEHSGSRFLWSIQNPPTENKDFREMLPEGFMDRTNRIGKVIGWAPQVAVLSHRSVGGFVSHCGWNSTLESLWFGIPMATWPLGAEQQMNAFVLVKELGLAVEIKLDYTINNPKLVTAEEIEKGMKQLIECRDGVEIRKRVKAMSEKSRMTRVENGSAYIAVGHFIDQVVSNSTLKT